MTKQLATIQDVEKLNREEAIAVLSNRNNLTDVIAYVRKMALSETFDVTTSKGRKDVGTAANNVVKSRKPITEAIDRYIVEHQTIVDNLKDTKSYVESEFKLIKQEVLRPRAEWQEEQDKKEAARVKEIKDRIENLRLVSTLTGNEDRSHIESLIEALEAQDLSSGFDEFTQEAMQAKQEAVSSLNNAILQIIEDENRRKSSIDSAINGMKSAAFDCMGKDKLVIQGVMDSISNIDIDDSFGDKQEEAKSTKLMVLDQLSSMLNSAPEPEDDDLSNDIGETMDPSAKDVGPEVVSRESAYDALLSVLCGDADSVEAVLEALDSGSVPGYGKLN